MQTRIGRIRGLLDQIEQFDLDNLDDQQRKALRSLCAKVNIEVDYVLSIAYKTLTVAERAFLPEVQREWAIYAVRHGHNPGAKVDYHEHIDAIQADGIKLANTMELALTFLKEANARETA